MLSKQKAFDTKSRYSHVACELNGGGYLSAKR